MEENSIQIYYAIAQPLAQKAYGIFLFFIFNSDSEKVIMLHNVTCLILKLNMLKQNNIHFPFPKCSTIFYRLIIWCTFPWTEKEKHAHQKAPSFLFC